MLIDDAELALMLEEMGDPVSFGTGVGTVYTFGVLTREPRLVTDPDGGMEQEEWVITLGLSGAVLRSAAVPLREGAAITVKGVTHRVITVGPDDGGGLVMLHLSEG